MLTKPLLKVSFFLALAFVIVAFGQPARSTFLGCLSGCLGYGLFWKAITTFKLKKNRFLLAGAWYFGIQLIQLSWMASLEFQPLAILGAYLVLSLWVACEFAILTLVFPKQGMLSWQRGLFLACLWTVFEWSRLFVLSGFTWNLVGLASCGNSYFLQAANLSGVYGLTFWTIIVNALAFRR